jgi:hypothetical protein
MHKVWIGLCAVLAVTVLAPAQAATKKLTRDAAIQKCVEYAKTVPEGRGVDNQRAAVGMFKDCMKKEGHRP